MSARGLDHIEISEAVYTSDYRIRLRFSDKTERVVDFGPFLQNARNPDTTDFRDLNKFKTFRVENGDLIWGDYQMIFPIIDLYKGEVR